MRGGQIMTRIRELTVRIELDYYTDWCGSAAQLVDEGLVPASVIWPAGRTKVEWKDDRFEYWLRRTRPADHPGRVLAAEWASIDWWELRVKRIGSDFEYQRRKSIERRAAALAKDSEVLTPAGRARAERQRDAWMRAALDERYQRLKESVGLGERPRKRARLIASKRSA
jgi:hypothetical protein